MLGVYCQSSPGYCLTASTLRPWHACVALLFFSRAKLQSGSRLFETAHFASCVFDHITSLVVNANHARHSFRPASLLRRLTDSEPNDLAQDRDRAVVIFRWSEYMWTSELHGAVPHASQDQIIGKLECGAGEGGG